MSLNFLETARQNRLGRIFLLGMEEVIGPDRALSLQYPDLPQNSEEHTSSRDQPSTHHFEHLCLFQSILEKSFGQIPGRGIAVRSGRAGFKHILREFTGEFGLARLEFRLLPGTGRLEAGSTMLAELFNQFTCQQVELDQDAQDLFWQMVHLPPGRLESPGSSTCQFAVGLLQEATYWLSGGKTYQVEETHCTSSDHTRCTIHIRKKPIQ